MADEKLYSDAEALTLLRRGAAAKVAEVQLDLIELQHREHVAGLQKALPQPRSQRAVGVGAGIEGMSVTGLRLAEALDTCKSCQANLEKVAPPGVSHEQMLALKAKFGVPRAYKVAWGFHRQHGQDVSKFDSFIMEKAAEFEKVIMPDGVGAMLASEDPASKSRVPGAAGGTGLNLAEKPMAQEHCPRCKSVHVEKLEAQPGSVNRRGRPVHKNCRDCNKSWDFGKVEVVDLAGDLHSVQDHTQSPAREGADKAPPEHTETGSGGEIRPNGLKGLRKRAQGRKMKKEELGGGTDLQPRQAPGVDKAEGKKGSFGDLDPKSGVDYGPTGPRMENCKSCGSKTATTGPKHDVWCQKCSAKKAEPPMAKPPSGANRATHVPTSAAKPVKPPKISAPMAPPKAPTAMGKAGDLPPGHDRSTQLLFETPEPQVLHPSDKGGVGKLRRRAQARASVAPSPKVPASGGSLKDIRGRAAAKAQPLAPPAALPAVKAELDKGIMTEAAQRADPASHAAQQQGQQAPKTALPGAAAQAQRAQGLAAAGQGAFQPAGPVSSGLELAKPKAKPGIFGKLAGRKP